MNKGFLWIMHYFYRVDGVLDEYRLAQLYKIGNQVAMGLLLYVNLSTLVGLAVAGKVSVTAGLLTMVSANLFAVMLAASYVDWAVSRQQLNVVEVDAQSYAQVLQRLKTRAVGVFIYFIGLMVLMQIVVTGVFGSLHEVVLAFTRPRLYLVTLVGGLLVAGVDYWQRKRKLRQL